MDYSTACTNCGEANFRVENDISYITGKSGFHVCNNCGFSSLKFPKIAKVEIEMLRKKFNKHPNHFFRKEPDKSRLYFYILFLLAILLGLLVTFKT